MRKNFFSFLLRLYPTEFRHEFGDELLTVFTAKCEDARQLGLVPLIYVWLQEILELPGNMFTEYWLLFTSRQLNGGKDMHSLSAKRIVMNVLLPFVLAIILWIINPTYINRFFSTIQGGLFFSSFMLMLIINTLLILGSSEHAGSHFAWIALQTVMAFLIIVLGPSFLSVIALPFVDSTALRISVLITLLLCNVALIIALIVLGKKVTASHVFRVSE